MITIPLSKHFMPHYFFFDVFSIHIPFIIFIEFWILLLFFKKCSFINFSYYFLCLSYIILCLYLLKLKNHPTMWSLSWFFLTSETWSDCLPTKRHLLIKSKIETREVLTGKVGGYLIDHAGTWQGMWKEQDSILAKMYNSQANCK